MKPKMAMTWSLLALVALLPAVRAEEVGPTKFDLPGPDWQFLTAYETKTIYSGGATAGSWEPTYQKVYYLAGADGTVKALLRVGGQYSKYSMIVYTGSDCPASKPHYYTQDFGTNLNNRTNACMVVSSRFSPSGYFGRDSSIEKALANKQLKFFKSGYFLRARYGSENGSKLIVDLFTQSDFKGLTQARPSTDQIFDVPPELVAWAEALYKEVKSSVYSFNGGLKLPPIEFKQ